MNSLIAQTPHESSGAVDAGEDASEDEEGED